MREQQLPILCGRDGVEGSVRTKLVRHCADRREILGRAEETLGTARITEVQESFAVARSSASAEIKPGDRVRMSSAKVKLTLLPLLGSVRENLVEAATNELVERLSATGRFQVGMGDGSVRTVKPGI